LGGGFKAGVATTNHRYILPGKHWAVTARAVGYSLVLKGIGTGSTQTPATRPRGDEDAASRVCSVGTSRNDEHAIVPSRNVGDGFSRGNIDVLTSVGLEVGAETAGEVRTSNGWTTNPVLNIR
jgi:hypothetical protein